MTPTPTPDSAPEPEAFPVRSFADLIAEIDTRPWETAVVQVPEFKARFTVRGLTRAESLRIIGQSRHPRTGILDQAKADELQILLGVTEPKLSQAEYLALRNRAAANRLIAALQAKITELTDGVAPDADTPEEPLAAAERFPGGASR
jgi:hypothetical protein